MATIEVNESLWNQLSESEKEQIAEHLKKHHLIRDNDTIAGNPNIPDVTDEGFLDDINPIKGLCKVACDAAAAAAAAALTLTGPALAAALVAIAVAREKCRKQC